MRYRYLVEGKGWAKIVDSAFDFETFCDWVRTHASPREKVIVVFQLDKMTAHMDEVPLVLNGILKEGCTEASDEAEPPNDKPDSDAWN